MDTVMLKKKNKHLIDDKSIYLSKICPIFIYFVIWDVGKYLLSNKDILFMIY